MPKPISSHPSNPRRTPAVIAAQREEARKAKACLAKAPSRCSVAVNLSTARFVARETGTRVATDTTDYEYDFGKEAKPSIFDANTNPCGDVEAFESAYPREMDGLRRAARKRFADENRGRVTA